MLAPRARFELATSRLTAECSTVELPGNAQRACFHSITRNEIRHDLSETARMLSTVEPPGSFAFCDGCAASSSEGEGTLGTSLNLGKRMRPRRSLTLFLLGGNLSVLQELECRPTSWADSRFAGSRITEDFNEVIGETILHRRG